jgi:DnaK suppressor protein
MDQTTLERFKILFNELLGREENLKEKMSNLFIRDGVNDETEEASRHNECQLALKLTGREQFFKKKIWRALKKIDDGTFGQCEECGTEIGLNRLWARPTAELCIVCKEEQEGVEQHMIYDKRSHSNGKALAMSNIGKHIPAQKEEIKTPLSLVL